MNKWWKFQKDISNHFWVIQNQPNFVVHLCQPKGHFRQPEVQNAHLVGKGGQWNLVDFELLKTGLRYLSEIFTICLSHVCANLMKKFLPLLNQPARNGPFLPKFWTALATVIVGIFFRKKFWWGFRPISVAYQKEFWISWKKRCFQIFQKPVCPYWSSSWLMLSEENYQKWPILGFLGSKLTLNRPHHV